MPTDDIFDLAWNIAKNERFKCGKCGRDCRVEIDGEETTCWDRWHSSGQHEQDMADDEELEKGFFDDFARKVKQKQKEQEALNEYIVNNLIRNPDGLEAGVAAHHRALEAMNRPSPPAMPESVDSVTATPPPRERESVEPSEIQPETVRAEIPRTGFRGGAEGAPTPPMPEHIQRERGRTQRAKDILMENPDIDETVADELLERASEPHQVADSWTVVKDPFANPFFNDGFASLTEEQPPEVTHDDTPTFSLQPDLIKGDSPEDALKNAGFDARQGDDMSLLPSSAFNKGDEAPRADTSLLPAGWDTE